MNLSQTQLSNMMSVAGLIVLVANQFGFVLEQNKVAFVMAAIWSLAWTAYNYYQRFKKGDVTLGGVRK
jgi:hypothetical protein